MFKNNSTLKNWCYTIILFLLALTGSFLCMKLNVHEHISTVFIFAVFLISLLTDGYFYGSSPHKKTVCALSSGIPQQWS